MAAVKFLVVDDAAFIRDLIKKTLRDNYPGATVHDANSASRAMAMCKSLRYDVILSDWEMPEMSGEEFLRWVREREGYAQTPFIMVSSRSEKDFIVKAIQAGVSDYIGKPFTPEELVAKINKQLKKVGHKTQSIDRSPQNPFEKMAVDNASKTTETSPAVSDSVSALTGGAKPMAAAPVSDSVDALTGGAKAAPKPKTKPKVAQAQISLASGNVLCVVQDISLQAMNGLIKRDGPLPAIMDNCVVSVVTNEKQEVARLNAYIFGLRAADNRPDCSVIKITVRFVDDDPAKLDILSRYIAQR